MRSVARLGIAKRLLVFVDESGTMPRRVDQGRFCAVALATTHSSFTPETAGWNRGLLQVHMAQGEFAGAARTLDPKVQDYERRSLAKERYLRAKRTEGLKERPASMSAEMHPDWSWPNHMYSICVASAIAAAVNQHVHFHPVCQVQVVLDRKSLRPHAESVFRAGVQRTRDLLWNALARTPEVGDEQRALLKQNMRFGQGDIDVQFDAGESNTIYWAGLQLADKVAGFVRSNPEAAASRLDRREQGARFPRFSVKEISDALLVRYGRDFTEYGPILQAPPGH